ncbi:hypothetical protein LTR12_007105, partial [Friedmanniomyces endolithicus]
PRMRVVWSGCWTSLTKSVVDWSGTERCRSRITRRHPISGNVWCGKQRSLESQRSSKTLRLPTSVFSSRASLLLS